MRKMLLLASLVLVMSACSKEEEDRSTVLSNEDYFPNTTGSTWTYVGPMEATLTVTGQKEVFDKKTYSEIASQGAQSESTYLYKQSGEYYLRNFAGVEANLLILKDNVAEGASWTQDMAISGFNSHFEYTLSEKNIEETVGGETFQNVIVVSVEQTAPVFGFETHVADLEFHFAKGVGIIKIVADFEEVSGLDAFNGSTLIDSYSIQ